MARWQSGQLQQTVNLSNVMLFVGSNPTLVICEDSLVVEQSVADA